MDRHNSQNVLRRQVAFIRDNVDLILSSTAAKTNKDVYNTFKGCTGRKIGYRITFTPLTLWYQVLFSGNGNLPKKPRPAQVSFTDEGFNINGSTTSRRKVSAGGNVDPGADET